MRMPSLLGPAFSAAILAASSLSLHASVTPRISQTPQDGVRATIAKNTSPHVKFSTDLGEAPSTQALQSLAIRFNMTAAQEAALDQLLIDLQNPSSPSYHQWLTPEQFAAQFGLAPADIATVSSWLTAQGLKVTSTARSGTFITFSGTVAQVEQAFGTQIHTVDYKGAQHYANVSDPTLPAAIAGVVTSVSGLNDFKLAPRSHRPQYTSSISGTHYFAPGDFFTIYNSNSLLSSNINGSGITIAVMGQTDISTSAVSAFRTASGLSTTNLPTTKLVPTSSDPGLSAGDIYEAQLDVEWSGAVAPSANILYVNSTDVIDTSLAYTIDNNLAPIITISYGDCEIGYGQASLNSFNQLFKQANAQGETIFGPAGDSGATDCDYGTTSASNGLAVDFPASSPYVTGVGGTMFGATSSPQSTATAPESGSYWNSTNNTYNGSAVSYIPESVWNETAQFVAGGSGLAAGGGGASAFFTKPYWQTGTGVPADSSRDVPDVALQAAADHDGTLICAPLIAVASGGSGLADCTSGFRNSSSNLDAIGGTSVATPSFAGVLALLEQKLGTGGLGNINPTIYALAASSYYSTAFHDITSGTNDSPCAIGTLNCPSSPDYIGFTAGTGYDQATGWGTPNVANLVAEWALVTPVVGTGGSTLSQTTLTASAFNVTIGTAITLNATVASNASGVTTVPTGTVQFLVDNVNVGSAVALTGTGTATYSLSTTGLTSGVHNVTAAYSGNSVFGGSKSTTQIDLTSASSPDFTLSPTTATMTSSAPGATSNVLTITVAGVNGFTGTVNFTASSTSQTLNAEYSFSVSALAVSGSGTTTFTLYAYSNTPAGQLRQAPVTIAKNGPPSWYAAGSGIAVAGLLMLVLPRRRKWNALLLALLSIGIVGASGCSGGTILSNGGTVTSSTTPVYNATPGTYPITVTAYTSTGLSHNINVTYIVQ